MWRLDYISSENSRGFHADQEAAHPRRVDRLQPPGPFGQGAVAFEYRIGTFEVTNAQYAEFLNTVAASDPRGLYNASMGSDPRGGITRSGIDGSFTYTVRPNMGNKPVNFVSFFDAARMANWLTNNQGSGSTESGAYTFSGEGIGAVTAITRDLSNPNQVFIPTSNEWFKAAYHQPASRGGDTDNFWRFATQSNIVPILAIATPTGDIANPGPNVVNYDFGSDWNEQNGNVTTVGSAGNTSFYGAFDMSGNVWEWNEDSFFAGDNLQRGGSFTNIAQFGIGSDFWSSGPPAVEQVNSGFRFASPALPPPCIADFNNDGSLDFFDVSGFLGAFNVQSHQADIAAPFGVLNFFDVAAYIGFFGQGCP
jgi:formylglycine-generating enzyme required for sulfatase activity